MTPLDLFLYVVAVCFGVPFGLALALVAAVGMSVVGTLALAKLSVWVLPDPEVRRAVLAAADARGVAAAELTPVVASHVGEA